MTRVDVTATATSSGKDFLLAHVAMSGDTTITAPSGWTQVASQANEASLRSAVFRKFAGASEPANYTFTMSAGALGAGGMAAYVGVDTTTPVDATATATSAGQSTSHTAPSVTTTKPNTRLVTLHGTYSGHDLIPAWFVVNRCLSAIQPWRAAWAEAHMPVRSLIARLSFLVARVTRQTRSPGAF